jgi:hypothetical protein
MAVCEGLGTGQPEQKSKNISDYNVNHCRSENIALLARTQAQPGYYVQAVIQR